jgi:hypothetical protein
MLPKLNKVHYLIDRSKTKEQAEKKIRKELKGTDNELVKLQRGVAHYRNTKTGQNTIAVKGTDKTNIKDLISDVKLGLGLSSSDKQFKKRRNDIKRILKENPNEEFILTGHSLGSSVGLFAMKNKGIRDRISNAQLYNTGYTPAFHKEMIQGLSKDDLKEMKNKITHHHVIGDPVSSFLLKERVGTLKKYNSENKITEPLKNHSLDNF